MLVGPDTVLFLNTIMREVHREENEIAITALACHGLVQSGMSVFRQDLVNHGFHDIRHYIGRLGALYSYAKILVRTSNHPRNKTLFSDIRIHRLEAPPVLASPITSIPAEGEGDLLSEDSLGHTIIRRMFSDNETRQRVREQYDDYTLRFRDHNIPKRLRENCAIRNGTRVHAELQIVEHFGTKDHEGRARRFWTEEHYIGSSKPVCYLCYSYVKLLPGDEFQLSGTHQKIYPRWRPPDLPATATEDEVDSRRVLIANLSIPLMNEIKRHLEKKLPQKGHRHDSSTGVSGATLTTVRTTGRGFPFLWS